MGLRICRFSSFVFTGAFPRPLNFPGFDSSPKPRISLSLFWGGFETREIPFLGGFETREILFLGGFETREILFLGCFEIRLGGTETRESRLKLQKLGQKGQPAGLRTVKNIVLRCS